MADDPDLMTRIETRLRARMPAIKANPYLASGGRLLVITEPDSYGWDNVIKAIEEDGVIALQLVDPVSARAALHKHFGEGLRTPEWASFTGPTDRVLAHSQALLDAAPLPDGWHFESSACPTHAAIAEAHALNRACDVSTTPAAFLRSEEVPNMSTFLWDDNGALAGFASGGTWYHPQGPMAGYFWAGSVSISPAHRRKGLGSRVLARLLVDGHHSLNWRTAYAVAREDNAASVSMIRRCGLALLPGRVTIIPDPNGVFHTT